MKIICQKNLTSIKADDVLYEDKLSYLNYANENLNNHSKDSSTDDNKRWYNSMKFPGRKFDTTGKRMMLVNIENGDTVHDVMELLEVVKYVSRVVVIRFNVEDAKTRVIHKLNDLKESDGVRVIINPRDNTHILLAKIIK